MDASKRAGGAPSTQALRSRVRYHYTGNAEGSTLRLTLGCLLANELAIELRQVGSGGLTFSTGEAPLTQWIADNALVTWLETTEPWVVERDVITTVDLPLNL